MAKTIYQDWIVEIGCDPDHRVDIAVCHDAPAPDENLVAEVNRALNTLTALEQDFIHLYYFSGRTLLQTARQCRISYSRAGYIHNQVIRKLRKELAAFVRDRFDITVRIDENCPICNSRYKDRINDLIRKKRKEDTWREIIGILKRRYGLVIKTPQILIGHQKYH